MSPCPPSQFMCQARGGACLGGEPRPPTPLAPPSILPSTIYLQIKSQSQIIFYFALFWGWER